MLISQGCTDKERRSLYGKVNSAFLLWEWRHVAAALDATRPEPGQTAEAAFAATVAKAKAGKWLRWWEGGNLGQSHTPPPQATYQPEGRPGPPPDPGPLMMFLPRRHLEFLQEVVARCLTAATEGPDLDETYVVRLFVEGYLRMFANLQRQAGGRLVAHDLIWLLQRHAALGSERETVDLSGKSNGADGA